jgi:hypothetical protein
MFKYFNLFEEIPEGLVERYSIIHIQLTLTFVKDHEIEAILQKAVKILIEL